MKIGPGIFFLLSVYAGGVMAQPVQKFPAIKIVAVKAGSGQQDAAFSNIELSGSKPHRLSYRQNYLQFFFADSNGNAPPAIVYQLEGLDYTWVACDHCTQVNYAHLDGGEYRFKVKANMPGAPVAAFSFLVEGNIWHKWWFVPLLFMYFLFFAGVIVYFFILYRFRQKHQQERLVHKEKMASMSEVTAGIAHEIQNPLNFVNNFSELNTELMEELTGERSKADGVRNTDLEDELMGDIKQNMQKITHHGKRADAIVKTMLLHAHANTARRQPTDINALVEEQIKLALQKQPGADKNFHCKPERSFEENLQPVSLVQQDIGTVIFNVLMNAFYATGEMRKVEGVGYEPAVWVSTKKQGNTVLISVKDNGGGIPQHIIGKIFQPFFTTKPTGQGTGLGLSLAYDIVKAHGGEIKVESKEGQGCEFVIQLPVKEKV